MATHYRRITAAALQALIEGSGSEYDALASFAAVRVGVHDGDVIVHVNGPDSDALPGALEACSLAELDPAVQPHVARATWEPVNAEDPGHGPEASIPPGASVLETGIAPNTFI